MSHPTRLWLDASLWVREGEGSLRGRLSISPLVHSHIHLHGPSQGDRGSEREPLIHKNRREFIEKSCILLPCLRKEKPTSGKLMWGSRVGRLATGKVFGSVGWDCGQHDYRRADWTLDYTGIPQFQGWWVKWTESNNRGHIIKMNDYNDERTETETN